MIRSRKTNNTLLLLKPETDFNVDAAPDALEDAIYSEGPQFSADITILERNNVRSKFGKEKHTVGRKLAKIEFMVEIRSNGLQTGLVENEPQIGRCLRTSGFVLAAHVAASVKGPYPAGEHLNPVTWEAATAYTGVGVVNLYLQVVTGGPSGTATVSITSDDPDTIDDANAAVVTSGQSFDLGGGVSVTPTFTGDLVAGDAWSIMVLPPKCLEYIPESDEDDLSSATLYLYKDGNLHIVTGAYGTCTFEGAVNGYGQAKFTYTGQYYDPVQVDFPTEVNFERTKPAQIELARLRIDGYDTCVTKFNIDAGVSVLPRLCANGKDGYEGTYISDRIITGGMDPEAALVGDQDFWAKLSDAKAMPLTYRMGTVPGNTVSFYAPNVQYTNLTYQDRDRIENYDAGLSFTEVDEGDDELFIVIH